MKTRTSLACVLILLAAGAAYAQTPTTPAPTAPLVLERIHSPFVVAPDYKVTDLDGELGQLAGIYAGRLLDNVLFVGGGVYWLANGPDGAELTYGGAMVGWSSAQHRRIRFGARGLVGVGNAELGSDVTVLGGRPTTARFGSRGATTVRTPTTVRVYANDDFFVFEPQANVLTRLTDHIGLDWSAGYRVIGFGDVLEGRLAGATGAVALQLTW